MTMEVLSGRLFEKDCDAEGSDTLHRRGHGTAGRLYGMGRTI
jgi:hypothetical protein